MAPVTKSKIATVIVGAGGAANIDFTNIPQIYTDLLLELSVRGDQNVSVGGTWINGNFNGVSTNRSFRRLWGNGTSAGSDSGSLAQFGTICNAQHSSSIFTNTKVYISNYTSSNYKSYSVETSAENNANATELSLIAGTWSVGDAINRITIVPSSGNLVQYSTATLYGIKSLSTRTKATGGVVTEIGGYIIHTFTSSGTFTPNQNLTVDYLVVGGGAGGGFGYNGYGAGGGGAGGLRSTVGATGGGGSLESGLALNANTNYTVTVGAGGTAGTAYYPSTPFTANSGSNSVFGSITSLGGGVGGWYGDNGVAGGSGGGAAAAGSFTGGSGTSGQGYAGGNMTNPGGSNYWGAAGGGGAGSVGANNNSNGIGANGGSGVSTSISGASTTYAAGGRGGYSGTTGNAPSSVNPNTGNGGGGGTGGNPGGSGAGAGAAGGSGIVIVRYPA